MNKKRLIISIVIALVVISVVIIITNSQNKNNDTKGTPTSSKKNVRIEKGLEKLTTKVKLAVENYTSYSVYESDKEKNERLVKYFPANSPVFSRIDKLVQKYIKNGIYKVDTEIVSVSSCEYSLSESTCINASTKTHFYSDSGDYSETQIYWLQLLQSGNVYTVFDMDTEE